MTAGKDRRHGAAQSEGAAIVAVSRFDPGLPNHLTKK
jgi:hypothetical protein